MAFLYFLVRFLGSVIWASGPDRVGVSIAALSEAEQMSRNSEAICKSLEKVQRRYKSLAVFYAANMWLRHTYQHPDIGLTCAGPSPEDRYDCAKVPFG
jgi:hypothetical protein